MLSSLVCSQWSASRKQCALRLLSYTALSFGTVVALAVLLRYLVVPAILLGVPGLSPYFYDWAIYGAYPEQTYISHNISAPRLSVAHWEASCDDGLVLLDLTGPSVSHLGVWIADMKGNVVYITDEFGHARNLKVQYYRGEPYLTFWAGKALWESGQGKYYMLDMSYRLQHTISAVGDDLSGDEHEFRITKDDTALITIYDRIHADLSSTDMDEVRDDWIVDCLFQEVDIATGKLLFEWRASDHFDDGPYLKKSFGSYVEDGSGPFDYFHMNSVDKDKDGNYLISLRHLHMVIYVDKQGKILWGLGGSSTDFEDISNGAASDFLWQHDAAWHSEEEGILTLFNNGNARNHYHDTPHSQGRVIRLDQESRTVELLHTYESLEGLQSNSQGSMQIHKSINGEEHAFIGWGSAAAFSEFTMDGDLICETHFAASLLFPFERAKSYRATKTADWKAEPHYDPSAAFKRGKIYVSWNGATAVRSWVLQGKKGEDGDFQDISSIPKSGFESSFGWSNTRGAYPAYRVAALDADGRVLRYSNVMVPSQLYFGVSTRTTTTTLVLLALLAAVLAYINRGIATRLYTAVKDGTWRGRYQRIDQDISLK